MIQILIMGQGKRLGRSPPENDVFPIIIEPLPVDTRQALKECPRIFFVLNHVVQRLGGNGIDLWPQDIDGIIPPFELYGAVIARKRIEYVDHHPTTPWGSLP